MTKKIVMYTAWVALGALAAGGCADAYRASADADVYRLLRDRKARALGYDPQSVSEPMAKPGGGAPLTRPAEEAARAERDAASGKDPGSLAQENDPGAPPSRRAYARIPVTPVPPLEPPALELPKPLDTPTPLGPYVNEPDRTNFDPFAADMASRLVENRYVYGPFLPRPKPLQFDLFAALRYGIQHSRSYKAQMDEMYLSALDVTLQRHLLSPRPFAGVGLEYSGGQQTSNYRSALTATMDAGVRQRLPYGGEIVARTLVSFVNALDGSVTDGESAQVVLSGSIPLLRGAGMVNLENLISSERELVYQVRQFEEFRRQFAIDVANGYFRLLAAAQSVNNRRVNVTNSLNLLERTRAIYAGNLGKDAIRGLSLKFLDVQRSEQQLLEAQNNLIDSQENYLNTLDSFKLLIGMDIRQDLDIVPVTLELNVPELEGRDAVALANRLRLDLQTARDRIEDARRGIAVAQNGLLPDLTLTGQAAAGNPADAAARSLNSRTLTYSAGINLDLPVDRLTERNQYRRALINFYQAQRGYDDLQDRVAADVRAAIRAVRSSQVSITIQKNGIELAQFRLENATLGLKRGTSDAREVVEAQTSLIQAQDRYEQNRADLQVQVLQFLRRTGTLRIDPETGTLGRAMDRSAGDWELPQERAGSERPAPAAPPSNGALRPG